MNALEFFYEINIKIIQLGQYLYENISTALLNNTGPSLLAIFGVISPTLALFLGIILKR